MKLEIMNTTFDKQAPVLTDFKNNIDFMKLNVKKKKQNPFNVQFVWFLPTMTMICKDVQTTLP